MHIAMEGLLCTYIISVFSLVVVFIIIAIFVTVIIDGWCIDVDSFNVLQMSSLPPVLSNLNPHVRQGLLGCILGDGHVQRGASGNCRYMVTAGANNLAYITHIFNVLLAAFCAIAGPRMYKDLKREYTQYTICTLVHPVFVALHALFYSWDEKAMKWIKHVPPSVIYWFDAIVLAYLIMDDGFWKTDSKTLVLCVEGFTQADSLLLIEALAQLDIIGTLQKRKTSHSDQRYRIFISRKSVETVRKLCLPHMVPSMHYKLGLLNIIYY